MLYRACEAYLNGAVSEFGYGLILTSLDDVMGTLMGIEGLTGIPVARQVAIGGKAESKAEGSQSSTTGQGTAQGSGTTTSGPTRSTSTSSTTSATAESTTPVIAPPPTSRLTPSEFVAKAIQEMTKKDLAGSSLAGACLMWMSTTDLKKGNFQHQVMLASCDGILKAYGAVIKNQVASKK